MRLHFIGDERCSDGCITSTRKSPVASDRYLKTITFRFSLSRKRIYEDTGLDMIKEDYSDQSCHVVAVQKRSKIQLCVINP